VASVGRPRSLLDLPPLYFALAIVCMLVLHRWLPIADLIDPPWSRLGWIMVVAGVALAVWGRQRFARAGTNVVPFTPSTALVTDGPFRFTRNPMYLGMMLVLLGGFVIAGTLGSLLVVPVFVWWIRHRFVLREEEHMRAHFGADYEAYRRRVRRWI
jgi:protein-S-isoprenylcysteine O-methyltransferase Ste14